MLHICASESRVSLHLFVQCTFVVPQHGAVYLITCSPALSLPVYMHHVCFAPMALRLCAWIWLACLPSAQMPHATRQHLCMGVPVDLSEAQSLCLCACSLFLPAWRVC
jgi:hypothetical protein